MKHSTWLTPTPEAPMADRAWRLDTTANQSDSTKETEVAQLQSGSDAGSIDPATRSGPRSTARGFILRWHDTFQRWLHSRLNGFNGVNPRFEHVLHQFSATIAAVDDPAIVEAALLRLAHQMAPASWIELVAGRSPADDHGVEAELGGGGNGSGVRTPDRWTGPGGQAVLEVPLRCGSSVFGRLRLRSRSGGRPRCGANRSSV